MQDNGDAFAIKRPTTLNNLVYRHTHTHTQTWNTHTHTHICIYIHIYNPLTKFHYN